LSRRPDYKPRKGGDEPKNPNEFQFLKDHQLKYFPTNEIPRTISAIRRQNPSSALDLTDDRLEQEIKKGIRLDPEIAPLLEKIQRPELALDEAEREHLKQFQFKEDTLLKDGLIYIPNDVTIKLQILQSHHDSLLAGHPGHDKTYELISRNYTWLKMRQFINNYIRTCDTCTRKKTTRQSPQEKLHLVPIPPGGGKCQP
jgi:Integrase zinc binding domain